MKLVLEKISKSFPGRRVFEDISMEVNEGETLVISGPNGSGKTTLIKIISSLLSPTSGSVNFHWDGRKFTGAAILPYAGIVAPDLFVYDELTAIENLDFFNRVSGSSTRDFTRDLSQYGLEGRGNDLVKSYSSGMKQRLKFLLAMMKKPPILLLDEPTTNLDDRGKDLVNELIKGYPGITVIATNEKKELEYAHRTVRLDG